MSSYAEEVMFDKNSSDNTERIDLAMVGAASPVTEELFTKIIEEARDWNLDEPLDGDAVEFFCEKLMEAMQINEGNV